MGIAEYCMDLDLQNLIQPSKDLQHIEQPFSVEEIDVVIAQLPTHKSPELDGFNSDFMKKCWLVIKFDFYGMCQAFHGEDMCVASINNSYITLVPKKDNPQTVNDYKPISLLNSSIKLIIKLLAGRLQKIITTMVHENQFGFIRTRTTQDCLAWAFEYLYLGQKIIKRW
jgi:hypothetical protein